jgi:hypothetical protein
VAKRTSSDRHAVQLEYRFDRLLLKKLEQAYQLLVPEIRRPVGAAKVNSFQEMTNEQDGRHLCTSLLGSTAGVEVIYLKSPSGDSPEDQLVVQFQGMIAEYERAQIAERHRRGKRHRAQQGMVNVLSGAPYGYRYVRKTDTSAAYYEVAESEQTWSEWCLRFTRNNGTASTRLLAC